MRKQLIEQGATAGRATDGGGLDLERLARVELTSEDPEHPVESALLPGRTGGWRAAGPGRQRIRLLFDEPLAIGRVRLVFEETEKPRTQEITLRGQADGCPVQTILVQQYTFSPPGTTTEAEEYSVGLDRAVLLELEIVPEIGGGDARASLSQLRLS